MAPTLSEIFQTLKKELKRYEPPLVAKVDSDSRYDLWTTKPVEIEGRKRKDVYFAGLIIQSSYVGFYFMPVYADADIKKVFQPELLRLLKGKSCFHIKTLDPMLIGQVKAALAVGFDMYKKRGWV
ncbi:MAG TPA: hypothetical protein VN285_08615 [Candidatus Deferrimicrobium sp.]|nr:hypothetical protein [Candidatus Deferrimicrobium sp.]